MHFSFKTMFIFAVFLTVLLIGISFVITQKASTAVSEKTISALFKESTIQYAIKSSKKNKIYRIASFSDE